MDELDYLLARRRSVKSAIRRAVKQQDYGDLFASDSIDTIQFDDTGENEAEENSDYDTDDSLPFSELKKQFQMKIFIVVIVIL